MARASRPLTSGEVASPPTEADLAAFTQARLPLAALLFLLPAGGTAGGLPVPVGCRLG